MVKSSIIAAGMFKNNRKKILLIGLNLILITLVLKISGYRVSQIKHSDLISRLESLSVKNVFFIMALSGFFLNYGLESIKWKISLHTLVRLNFLTAAGSVLGGTAVALVTPNRSGDIAGKIWHPKIPDKVRAAVLNIPGSMAQLACTCCGGLWSIWLISFMGTKLPFYDPGKTIWFLIASFTTVLAIVIYFNQIWFFTFIGKIRYLSKHGFALRAHEQPGIGALWKIGLFSAVRFIIFNLQLWCILQWISPGSDIWLQLLVCPVYFFLIWFIPTHILTELGVRGSVAVALFPAFGFDSFAALLGSQLIWLLNVALPGILGSFILLYHQLKKY